MALFGRRVARRNDRFTLLALEAARQAIDDAELAFDNGLGHSTGVLIGTAIGGILTLLENHIQLLNSGPRRVSPFMTPMMMPNAASATVAIHYGLTGPNLTVASACATGSHAIGEAMEMVRRGDADVMICGGSEAVIADLAMAAFKNMGAVSTRNDEPQRASRPFDAERDGFVMGEGAATMVLEGLEHAQRRGARIYAELVGYGATADAFHITAPEEEGIGAARAMELPPRARATVRTAARRALRPEPARPAEAREAAPRAAAVEARAQGARRARAARRARTARPAALSSRRPTTATPTSSATSGATTALLARSACPGRTTAAARGTRPNALRSIPTPCSPMTRAPSMNG